MQKIIYIIAVTVLCCSTFACKEGADAQAEAPDSVLRVTAEDVRKLLNTDSVTEWNMSIGEMPEPNTELTTYSYGDLTEFFNDSNAVHWEAASAIGIEPIRDIRGCWETRFPLEKIATCCDFYVEELTHSSPYLVPPAARMVHDIGRRFQDKLRDRSGAKYRIKVSSALRTPESIKRLQKINKNSVDSSVHLCATTIDITYAGFICDDQRVTHKCSELKALLAEVLKEMRDEGRCYVKFEQKQPCFHITCRK